MQGGDEKSTPDVLDVTQLIRIEAVHRGFLYQHLYTVGCLLLAQAAAVDVVMVELDEDIELVTDQGRIYVQVKTRSKPIIPSDISSALERFENLRNEHAEGMRKGERLPLLSSRTKHRAFSSSRLSTIKNSPLMFFSFGPNLLLNATRHFRPPGSR
ncbi:TPA: hypothetical protein ACID6K_001178 [Pseudomonas aeruginosa]